MTAYVPINLVRFDDHDPWLRVMRVDDDGSITTIDGVTRNISPATPYSLSVQAISPAEDALQWQFFNSLDAAPLPTINMQHFVWVHDPNASLFVTLAPREEPDPVPSVIVEVEA